MNNNIAITLELIEKQPWMENIESFALAVLDKLEKHNWNLSLFFCNNDTIQKLNSQYRNLDESTDVLSFIMGETQEGRFLPGDVVISLEKVIENSGRFGVSPGEELRRLLIHGILHLSGMDHTSNGENEEMLILQDKLLRELGGGEP